MRSLYNLGSLHRRNKWNNSMRCCPLKSWFHGVGPYYCTSGSWVWYKRSLAKENEMIPYAGFHHIVHTCPRQELFGIRDSQNNWQRYFMPWTSISFPLWYDNLPCWGQEKKRKRRNDYRRSYGRRYPPPIWCFIAREEKGEREKNPRNYFRYRVHETQLLAKTFFEALVRGEEGKKNKG